MKDEFTYPLQNFNGATVHPTFYWECEYLSMLELKLNQSSKKGTWKGDTVTTNEPEEATPMYGCSVCGCGCVWKHKFTT